MEEEIKNQDFSLTPILNEETKEYSLTHFDEVKAACEEFIGENMVEEIKDDSDLRTLKKCRTAIRKKKDKIKSVRLALIKLFSWQFLELEKMLDTADYKLKTIKEEFEAEKVIEEKDYELKETLLSIKYRDPSVIDEIKKIAVEKGCTITEIKENK